MPQEASYGVLKLALQIVQDLDLQEMRMGGQICRQNSRLDVLGI